jgi:hypothetical protein
MQASRMMPSLMATMPTWGWRYQQGCPRRVMLPSMMSSATRKYAWRVVNHAGQKEEGLCVCVCGAS